MHGEGQITRDFVIGLTLAILSSVFIGSSFILKKIGLLRYARRVTTRASEGGFGYLREWTWWAGMILMTLGELLNFAAFAFAPATLVTPLGALSVIVSAILAAKILNEKLNIIGKVGCILCVIGSTVVVIHSPKEQEINDVEELVQKMKEPGFIVYASVLFLTALVLICFVARKYGSKNILIYIVICSALGSFTVIGCKGVGTAIKVTARGDKNEFKNEVTYVLIGVVITCIVLQLNYLNKALDTFNTAVVTPIYYVFFTSSVIVGSAILYKEFFNMGALDIVGDLCGFLTIISGIFLLNAFKDLQISLKNMPKLTKRSDLGEEGGVATGVDGSANSNYTVDVRTVEDVEAEIRRNQTEGMLNSASDEDGWEHISPGPRSPS